MAIWKNTGQYRSERVELFLVAESFSFLQPLLERARPAPTLRVPSGLPHPSIFAVDGAKLFLYGQQVGTLSFCFVAAHEPFLQQSPVGVTSEQGVKAFSPIVHFGRANHPTFAQAEGLRSQVSNLVDLVLRLPSGPSDDSNSRFKSLRSVLAALESSLSPKTPSSAVLSYANSQNLLDMQNALIDGAEATLQLIHKVPKRLEEAFFGVIWGLLERQELLLQNFLACLASPDRAPAAVRTAVRFHSLLSRLLQLDFDFFEQRNLSAPHKTFTEQLFVFLFFRLPDFRALVLGLIDGKPHDSRTERPSDRLQSVLDWNGLLFDRLPPSDPDLQVSRQRMTAALGRNWAAIIHRKSAFFFIFLGLFVGYSLQRLSVHDQRWQEVPGYSSLTDALFQVLWDKPISGCAEVMTGPAFDTLKNPQVIDRFVGLLVNKASRENVHLDSKEVAALFRLLRQLFNFLRAERMPAGVVLNVHALLNMLVLFIESDNVQATLQALHFLATFGEAISQQAMADFAKLVIKFFFFRLFLHWHDGVRLHFFHFLFQKAVLPADKAPARDTDRLLLKVNGFANLILHADALYQQQRRRWESMPKTVRVKTDFLKLREQAAQEAHDTFGVAGPKDNLLFCCPRFARVLSEQSEPPSDLEGMQPPSLRKAIRSELSIRKVHNYQNLLKDRREDRINPASLPYCAEAALEFRTMANRYGREKSFGSEVFAGELSQSRLLTAVDRFESQGD